MMGSRVKALQSIASELIGDGKKPNVFFVTKQGDVKLITLDFQQAYDTWCSYPRNIESSLEDRKTGVICTCEPEEDGGKKLVVIDDSDEYR